ncbi:MAG: thrombospondin type 3 repeat-containing protein [Deferrisomatales bacterium]|nr:thrombospondin type 3 repeat-containing protein [Deferrisomatales bacterium]
MTGYILHYGTTSRTAPGFAAYASHVDVGNVTQHSVALPDDGATYYLAVVAYNASGLRSDYSAEVSAAPTTAATLTISARAGAGGSISPSGSVRVDRGGSQSFEIAPSWGYRLADVRVDGASVGAGTTHTFPKVHADRSITAVFALAQETDGFADSWKLHYFGTLDVAADADPDGDGMTNWEEYLYGTDPTEPGPNPALTPAVRAPVSGGTVTSLSPELSVYNALSTPQGEPKYEFVLASDRGMDQVVAAASGIEQGTDGTVTTWSAPQSLQDRTRYYWRARVVSGAAASEWTPVCTFYVDTSDTATRSEVEGSEYVAVRSEVQLEVDDPAALTRGVVVDLAAAAVPYDYVLTVGSVEGAPTPADGARVSGRVVELGPHGLRFANPVKILLPYTQQTLDDAGVTSPGELAVFTYNTTSLAWDEVPVVAIDYLGRRLVSEVEHFSLYTVGAAASPSPGAPPAGATGGGGGGGCFLQSLGF